MRLLIRSGAATGRHGDRRYGDVTSLPMTGDAVLSAET